MLIYTCYVTSRCEYLSSDPAAACHDILTQDTCNQPHIGLLKHLTELHVQDNAIHTLDQRLGCCTQLALLDISNNAITSLPYSM